MRYHIPKPTGKGYTKTSPHKSGFCNVFWRFHCNTLSGSCQA
nr:MAG TPA: hypothetical protein [Caudoviricetes sp.]